MRKKDIIKMIMQHAVLPAVYRAACLTNRVDKKLVVLADAHNRKCPVYMRTLAAELKKRGYKVRGFFYDTVKTACEGEASHGCKCKCAMHKGSDCVHMFRSGRLDVLRRMCSFMKLYAQAGTVVICDNFLPVASCRKRKKTRVVQLWHGCGAYKKFGYDTTDDIPRYYRGNVYRNYDLVTVSSEYCAPFFESAMRAKAGAVRPVGVPATDVLIDEAWMSRARRRFFEACPDAVGKKVVLWAPTFRGRADGTVSDRDDGTTSVRANGTVSVRTDRTASVRTGGTEEGNDLRGAEYIDRLSKFNDVYLIRHNHPHSESRAVNAGENEAADDRLGMPGKVNATDDGLGMPGKVNATDDRLEMPGRKTAADFDIYTLIAVSDLLITDYSSVCYDFVLAGKPVIFFMPDHEEYMERRGFYMGIDELPGPVVTDEERIVTEVAKVLATGRCDGSIEREEFLRKYMSSCNGRSTERVADIIDEWHGKRD